MTRAPLIGGTGFVEVADRCFVARMEWVDVNLGLVAGSAGVVVIDTHASEAAGQRLADRVAALGLGDVLAVVNTHAHYDHVFGNRAFTERWPKAPVVAHEEAAASMVSDGSSFIEAYSPTGPHADEVGATRLAAPTETFSSVRMIDLGDRSIELLHPGRGHTGGDVVVRVPDADVLFAGDLVEEAGPPAYGEDCYPLDWPATLDLVVSMLTDRSLVVPGHGQLVDKSFVEEQRAAIGVVAETVRDLVTRGIEADQVSWPYPREELAHAIDRGREHLPRGSRSLPLL